MKIAIVKYDSPQTNKIEKELRQLCATYKIELNQENPDVVVSIGGDGTFLSAFQQYSHLLDSIRFLGIHTGHLGFYTDWREYEVGELIKSLMYEQEESICYPVLDVEIILKNSKKTIHRLALNEATLKRVDGTLTCDVFIKGEHFERFRGDGLCISTPTGSTGYNNSLGGAVIHPSLEALQLAEIASINNRVYRSLGSSLIIAPYEWITLKPLDSDGIRYSIDQENRASDNISAMRVRIADQRVHFAKYRHTPFWIRVKDAFIGDVTN